VIVVLEAHGGLEIPAKHVSFKVLNEPPDFRGDLAGRLALSVPARFDELRMKWQAHQEISSDS